MPSGVRVTVTDHAVISALNTPGGAVFDWRDEVGREVKARAEAMAPVNNPGNAEHRGGVVGIYAASFGFDRRGSSGHHVVGRVTNSADHAIYVEFGRSASAKHQRFSMAEVEIKGTAYFGLIVRVGAGNRNIDKWLTGKRTVMRRERLEAFEKEMQLIPNIGDLTHAREGEHILGRALVGAMGSQGITARVDM